MPHTAHKPYMYAHPPAYPPCYGRPSAPRSRSHTSISSTASSMAASAITAPKPPMFKEWRNQKRNDKI
eukprot:6604173-Prymnesium_polylepis.1